MRKTRSHISMIALLILCSVTFLTGAHSAYADTIKGAGIVYCPYICDPKVDGKDGFMVDIAKTVFQKAGHTYTVEIMPFARGLEWVIQGEYDALTICNKMDTAEGNLIFPDIPIAMVFDMFIVRKGETWKYNGIESLKNIMVGSVVGYTWRDAALTEYITNAPEPNVQKVSGDHPMEKNLTKLLAKRIDAVLDSKDIARYIATKMGILDQIDSGGELLPPNPHFIAFSAKHPKAQEYARLLSEGMKALRASGELEKILAQYGLKDWEQQ